MGDCQTAIMLLAVTNQQTGHAPVVAECHATTHQQQQQPKSNMQNDFPLVYAYDRVTCALLPAVIRHLPRSSRRGEEERGEEKRRRRSHGKPVKKSATCVSLNRTVAPSHAMALVETNVSVSTKKWSGIFSKVCSAQDFDVTMDNVAIAFAD
jgi:hypothetical protein